MNFNFFYNHLLLISAITWIELATKIELGPYSVTENLADFIH